ncbi:hypothetical protein JMJ58_17250 [Haloterrigena salifodinae]|uniref:Uncharacterized protein n=1 Tax=Haloterrigena salifodinae TaxID=2675099 RepID=A0A8T8DYQ0_9EURY|nr:hypothetical protein [Haloterrigena salifodinae]QRV14655.1 hypothetical protein JMJ58_17250 [Haloterrigena salifodinae]
MSVESSTLTELAGDLTKEKIWSYRDEIIQLGFELSEVALIEALPASGKSRGSIQWAADTGNKMTLLAPRHSLLDEEYEPWCDKFDLTSRRLASFYRDCESFTKTDEGGYEPIDPVAEDLMDDYQQGIDGKHVHAQHRDSTCQQDGECPYLENLSFDPDEYDVLLGTYRHAHVEEWIDGRYVVFDEFPGSAFLKTFNGDTEDIISAYLQEIDDLPFSSYRDLLRHHRDKDVQDDIESWKTNLHESLTDSTHVRQSTNPSVHTMAPLATLAVIEEESLENDWQYSILGNGRRAVLNPNSNNWTFLLPPDVSSAPRKWP